MNLLTCFRSQESNTQIIQNILHCRLRGLPLEVHVDMFVLEQSISQTPYRKCLLKKEQRNKVMHSCRIFLTSQWPKSLNSLNGLKESKVLTEIHKLLDYYKRFILALENSRLQDGFILNTFKDRMTKGYYDLNKSDTVDLLYRLRHFCAISMAHEIRKCITVLERICKTSSVIVVKTIRLEMKSVQQLTRTVSGLKVIHLVRDPRAVILSRIKVEHWEMLNGYPNNMNLALISKQFCAAILNDVEDRRRIELRNQGKFLQCSYENMISHPLDVLTSIYRFIQIDSHPGVRGWLWQTMHAQKDNGAIGTLRKDPIKHIRNWKTTFSKKAILEIDSSCLKLYNTLGYTPIKVK